MKTHRQHILKRSTEVADGRGSNVLLLGWRMLSPADARSLASLRKAVRNAMTQKRMADFPRTAVRDPSVIALFLFMLCIPAQIVFEHVGLPSWIAIVVCVALALTVAGWWRMHIAALISRSVRDTLLEHGLCPSCGYHLAGLPPQQDGLTQCPECGAAWKAAAAGRGHDEGGKPGLFGSMIAIDADARRDSVFDDSGRVTPLVTPRTAEFPAQNRERISDHAKRRIDRAFRNAFWTDHAVFAVGWSLLCVAVVHKISRGKPQYGVMEYIILFVAIGAGLGFIAFRRREVDAHIVLGTMLGEGLCPSCAGVLRADGRQASGRGACACCGAVWDR